MSIRTMALIAILTPLTLGACADSGGGEWRGEVVDSAGVTIVRNTDQGVWGPDQGWSVQRELIIGTTEGDPDYQFGQITGLDVADDGRIYVTDQQAQEIRVYGPDGGFIMTMGKPGSGPGELSQGVGQLFVGPGDTVVIPDMGLQRITRYTPDGAPVASTPLPMSEGIPAKWMEGPDNYLLQQAMIMQIPGQEDVEQKNLLLRRSWSGEVTDTVMEMPIGKTVSFAGGQPSFRLFESEPMWTVGPDERLYFGVNSEYRIEVRSPDGELIRVIQKSGERQPVSERDQAEYRRVIRDAWNRQGMPAQAMEMMSQALSFADHYPAYANFVAGPDGTLWVQGIQTPEAVEAEGGVFDLQDIGGPTWEVFDAEGRLLGTVHMPARFNPIVFHDHDLYGVLRDDLDVQYVARFRIQRGEQTPARAAP